MVSKKFSVAVMVSNAKKSAKWYEDVLGFEASKEGHWVTVGPKGADWKMHLCEGDLEPGNTGIALYSKDLKKEVSKLKKKGAKFAQDYTKKDWGEIAKVEDPDGNVIWLSKGGP